MESSPNIDSVPTEILLSILSILPSRSLLPLLPVGRRFYSVSLRILHTRLMKAAPLPDHRLILECYHPSAKISTPYLYCDHLSTDSLESGVGDGGQTKTEGETVLPRPSLGDLGQIYSHFRLVVQDENRRSRSRYPRQSHLQVERETGEAQLPEPETLPTQDIYLDESEQFSQLCTVTNLVKIGSKPGMFVSHVNVSDGIIRVWRQWMARQTEVTAASVRATDAKAETPGNGSANPNKTEILWADQSQIVGLRFRVMEKDMPKSEYHPVLTAVDEEPPVAYRLELEELVVRASHLLLAMEKSESQGFATSGFFFEPRGASPCPAQYFYWMNFQQTTDPDFETDHSGIRRISRWVPVQEVP